MRALKPVGADVYALLTDAASLLALKEVAEPEGYAVLEGPEEDVLARYGAAIRRFSVNEVVRATGDNPLTSARLARDIIAAHRAQGSDLSHYLGVPWGSGVEVVTAEALLEAERDARAADEREHITTYLYRHPERFRVLEPSAPAYADAKDCRVTVDTPSDLEEVRRIFAALYDGQPIEIDRVIDWLRKNPAPAGAGRPGPSHG